MQQSERAAPKDEGWVYTLECEDGFWYVGWTKEPEVRIASHFLGRGCLHEDAPTSSSSRSDQGLQRDGECDHNSVDGAERL